MTSSHTRDIEDIPDSGMPSSPEEEFRAGSEYDVMSIEECRRLLDGIDLSDEEVAAVRDALYVVVRRVFDEIVL